MFGEALENRGARFFCCFLFLFSSRNHVPRARRKATKQRNHSPFFLFIFSLKKTDEQNPRPLLSSSQRPLLAPPHSLLLLAPAFSSRRQDKERERVMPQRRRGRRRLVAPLLLAATAAAVAALLASRPCEAHLLDLPPLPPPPPSRKQQQQQQQPRPAAEVCFVVRTYSKHGEAAAAEGRAGKGTASPPPPTPPPPPLARLLRSLEAQTSPAWLALLLVADEDPFLGLEGVVDGALGEGDGRVWVWARASGPGHRAAAGAPSAPPASRSSASSGSPPPTSSLLPPPPRSGRSGRWARGFHRKLFSLTDDAIQWGCPRSAELVVVTNGDNAYAPGFVERALEEARGGGGGTGAEGPGTPPAPADLVLFDYASRYAWPGGVPCERFGALVPEASEQGVRTKRVNGGKSGNSSSRSSSGGDGGGGVPSPSPLRLPLCKRNLGRWCHTDLGAVAFRLSRLRGGGGGGFGGEASFAASAAAAGPPSSPASRPPPRQRRRRFTDAETLAAAARRGLSADSLDGVFVETLIQTGGWVARRVAGGGGAEGSRDESPRGQGNGGAARGEREREGGGGGGDGAARGRSPLLRSHECFFDHAPSPHACALSGGIWDDSRAATFEGAGGKCLGEEEAEARLLAGAAAGPPRSSPPRALELVSVRVLAGDDGAPPMRCLRWRDREGHRRAMRAFFGALCTEEG